MIISDRTRTYIDETTVYDIVTAGPSYIRGAKNVGSQTFISIIDALASLGIDISEWLKWIDIKPFPLS